MSFVVDASVVLAWGFEDAGEYAVEVLEGLRSTDAVVASLWPLEVTNGLLAAERRGRIEPADARRFLHLLLSLPIVVDRVATRHVFEATHALARKHGLASYDAASLELAVRLGAPMATLDGPLLAAAEAEGLTLYTGG
ncbi:MAG TPA: type II toxin-antitoxin system VapC family toxin [Longimicrobiales bacterium]|nr:type II toxin-antitoxin system VapC family toxin [Longimicrobiales bacterium]